MEAIDKHQIWTSWLRHSKTSAIFTVPEDKRRWIVEKGIEFSQASKCVGELNLEAVVKLKWMQVLWKKCLHILVFQQTLLWIYGIFINNYSGIKFKTWFWSIITTILPAAENVQVISKQINSLKWLSTINVLIWILNAK